MHRCFWRFMRRYDVFMMFRCEGCYESRVRTTLWFWGKP